MSKNKFIPYIILSYPRSGNHWVRYCVEWFSGMKTVGDKMGEHEKDINNQQDTPIFKRADIPHVNGASEIIAKKRHYLNAWDNRDAKLFMILRNPMECVSRHLQISGVKKIESTNDKVKNQLKTYYGILGDYDAWPSDKKYVHYEDILTVSEGFNSTMKDMLIFFNIYDEDKFNKFINKIEYHKKNCIGTLHAKSKTSGNEIKFYSKNIQHKDKWKQYVKNTYGDLHEKYLIRYE